MTQMKFALGKKQIVNNVNLDDLFTDLKNILLKCPLIPVESIDTLVSEWVNDILFIAGIITEEDLKEETEALNVESRLDEESPDDVD
ncbi:hypothetical protein KEJ23_01245 [Candidatus Bathyarchaeota archaeon]|nr:hypothetical protein [Candidatus Bathyarchaeota archaeon]